MPRPSRYLGSVTGGATLNGGSTGPLVAHGYKCPRGCGATLLPADPLPHRCLVRPMVGAGDVPGGRARRTIVASRRKPRTAFWRQP